MIHASLSSRARYVAAVAALVLVTAGSSTIAAGQGNGSADTIRPLVSRPEGQDSGIWWAHISGNGKTAFVWTRDELLPGLRPTDRYRLFAIDIATSQVRLVSDDGRLKPEAVSSDGRFVVASYGLSDTEETAVVVDTVTGYIHALDLAEPLTFLSEATISADGSTIAFAATTGRGDTLTSNRMFIVDVATGAVTEPLAGADGSLFDLYLNSDATILAFASQAGNLDMSVGSRGSNAVIFDRVQGTLEYAYTTTDGGVPDGQSAVYGISADGSKVLIRSGASNFVGAPTSEPTDSLRPFLYDRSTGTMTSIVIPELGLGPGYVADHSADLGVLAVVSETDSLALRHEVAESRSTSLYGTGVEPDGPLWTGALDPISLDDSGDIAVILSQATNLGPDRDEFTDAFIVGAGQPDPTAQVYVPPAVPLPPELLTLDTVTPTPIDPPPSQPQTTTTSVPTTNVPATVPEPSVAPTPAPPEPDERADDSPVWSGPFSSNPLLEVACRLDDALGLGALPCGRPVTVVDRIIATLLIFIVSH